MVGKLLRSRFACVQKTSIYYSLVGASGVTLYYIRRPTETISVHAFGGTYLLHFRPPHTLGFFREGQIKGAKPPQSGLIKGPKRPPTEYTRLFGVVDTNDRFPSAMHFSPENSPMRTVKKWRQPFAASCNLPASRQLLWWKETPYLRFQPLVASLLSDPKPKRVLKNRGLGN